MLRVLGGEIAYHAHAYPRGGRRADGRLQTLACLCRALWTCLRWALSSRSCLGCLLSALYRVCMWLHNCTSRLFSIAVDASSVLLQPPLQAAGTWRSERA